MSQTPITLTIALNGQNSDALTKSHLRHAKSLSIQAPAALDVGTYTVEVSYDGTTFATLQSGGVDVTIEAGQVVVISHVAFRALRIASTEATQSEARSFVVTIQEC